MAIKLFRTLQNLLHKNLRYRFLIFGGNMWLTIYLKIQLRMFVLFPSQYNDYSL